MWPTQRPSPPQRPPRSRAGLRAGGVTDANWLSAESLLWSKTWRHLRLRRIRPRKSSVICLRRCRPAPRCLPWSSAKRLAASEGSTSCVAASTAPHRLSPDRAFPGDVVATSPLFAFPCLDPVVAERTRRSPRTGHDHAHPLHRIQRPPLPWCGPDALRFHRITLERLSCCGACGQRISTLAPPRTATASNGY